MKRAGKLLMGLVVALALFSTTSALAAESREPEDAVRFEVKGNAKDFQAEKWKKNKAVKLADCVVREVHLTPFGLGKVPDEYMNRETMQALFDEILAGEVVILSERQEAEWRQAASGIISAGMMITCESPNGSNLYSTDSKGTTDQKPGQGYAHLTLTLVDSQEKYLENVVCVRAQVYTSKSTKGGYVFIRSLPLCDLMMAMCKQSYAIQELSKAQKVGWGNSQETGTSTADTQVIAQLVEALTSGERVYKRFDVTSIAEFRFFMPDGRLAIVDIVRTIPKDDKTDEDKEERQYFTVTPEAFCRVEPQAVNDVIYSAGLRKLRNFG